MESNPPDSRVGRRCLYLGERLEHREGCGGWGCRHACTSTETAVIKHLGCIGRTRPSRECQTCPQFEDDGQF